MECGWIDYWRKAEKPVLFCFVWWLVYLFWRSGSHIGRKGEVTRSFRFMVGQVSGQVYRIWWSEWRVIELVEGLVTSRCLIVALLF